MNDLNGIGSCTGRLTLTKLVYISGFRFVSEHHSCQQLKILKKTNKKKGVKQMIRPKIQLLSKKVTNGKQQY